MTPDMRERLETFNKLATEKSLKRPTIAELEEILASQEKAEIDILPNGEVFVKPSLASEAPAILALANQMADLLGDYERAMADHRKLVRELDVVLNGEGGAARQASLCDLIEPARAMKSALERLIYEITALSPCDGDGSHSCRITADTLQQARVAYWCNPEGKRPVGISCDQDD
jgi:hypothetical protein